jgi:3-isopropylmalate dehydrogenase
MQKKVLLLPGDGIGQEVVAAATAVMEVAAQQSGCDLDISDALIGGAAIDATGEPFAVCDANGCRARSTLCCWVGLVAQSGTICQPICGLRKAC